MSPYLSCNSFSSISIAMYSLGTTDPLRGFCLSSIQSAFLRPITFSLIKTSPSYFTILILLFPSGVGLMMNLTRFVSYVFSSFFTLISSILLSILIFRILFPSFLFPFHLLLSLILLAFTGTSTRHIVRLTHYSRKSFCNTNLWYLIPSLISDKIILSIHLGLNSLANICLIFLTESVDTETIMIYKSSLQWM